MIQVLSRRRFIYAATGSVAVIGAFGIGSNVACTVRDAEARDVAARLMGLMGDIPHPYRLAAWWSRNGSPAETNAAVMQGGLGQLARLECPDARRSRFAAMTRHEFKTGRIVLADRLVVCEAECLLATFVLTEFEPSVA